MCAAHVRFDAVVSYQPLYHPDVRSCFTVNVALNDGRNTCPGQRPGKLPPRNGKRSFITFDNQIHQADFVNASSSESDRMRGLEAAHF